MLPTHRSDDRLPHRARGTPLPHALKHLLARPSLRWPLLGIALISCFWLLSSLPRFPRFGFGPGPGGGPLSGFRHHGGPGHPRPPIDIRPLDGPAYLEPRPKPPPARLAGAPTLWSARADKVRDAFVHAYGEYEKYALPADELLPLSKGSVNNFNGWAVSMVDALDTMWLMGLHDTFADSIAVVANISYASHNDFIPFFETVIRYLGGLLSAYALSGEPILLSRADELGRALLPALNTTSGLPLFAVNPATGETKKGWNINVLWAEATSCQMEYKYLAHLTGRREYYDKVENVMKLMADAPTVDGLFAAHWDVATGKPASKQYTVGAYADSGYEYLLKQYLLSARSEPAMRDLYIDAANGILTHLFYSTPNRGLVYVTDTVSSLSSPSGGGGAGAPTHRLEHLSCFLPGLLALGVQTLGSAGGGEGALSAYEEEMHMWAAKGLAYTCAASYGDTATGLGPDELRMEQRVLLSPGESGGQQPEYETRARPEHWARKYDRWVEQGRPGGVPPGTYAGGFLEGGEGRASGARDWTVLKSAYLLRPETVESLYVMWRVTGDAVWRERGWAIFEAIERGAVPTGPGGVGYASVRDVDVGGGGWKNEMPSFFLAETLKYLFLLFTDEELVPLERWVFNTEAHPLPVFEWSEWEREAYGIGRRA
ncbi:glycoside hydrolase family 47 protein [Coniophora puteana RWD-64-598 SS2]|uniref:alpha-1,2-Mannosidase n=1 Tax=Coniophora puteana (strain RWD-64-598) TaxID=741705 RepID=A0A5M3MJ50_CONPW|nr:glycoside hydrolase family 47 protein [Coniophora puteana RWD-64-598 SS2]EIW79066.1 glycoside hydrolase family 47 protein [Coniophora puteana RWD-64-598 SS2]